MQLFIDIRPLWSIMAVPPKLKSDRDLPNSMKTRTAPKKNNVPSGRYYIEAVGKAMDVLFAFQGHSEGLTLDDVVSHTTIAKSSVYRLLCTLVEAGLLELQGDEGRYLLGSKLFQLTSSAEPSIRKVAEPRMRKLWAEVQETVNLGVLSSNEIYFLSRIVSPHPFRLEVSEGGRAFIHATALGKAIAAYLPKESVGAILKEKKMAPSTSKTITNVARFWEELENIRAVGYAIDNEEIVEGGRCIAAPIFNAGGHVIAALSISGPTTRINNAKVPQLATLLKSTCREISARLGYPA
jgi:IclR family KDG regulon transcriptional repressor